MKKSDNDRDNDEEDHRLEACVTLPTTEVQPASSWRGNHRCLSPFVPFRPLSSGPLRMPSWGSAFPGKDSDTTEALESIAKAAPHGSGMGLQAGGAREGLSWRAELRDAAGFYTSLGRSVPRCCAIGKRIRTPPAIKKDEG